MATIDFTRLLLLTPLCLTTVLISSVNVVRPDGKLSTPPPLRNQNFLPELSSQTGERFLINIDDKDVSKNVMVAEGGPILVSTSTQDINSKAVTGSYIYNEFRVKENVPKERNATPSVVARKGVEEKKVKPRKGVNETGLELVQTTTSFSSIGLENMKIIAESASSMTKTIHIQPSDNTSKLNATDSHFNGSLNRDSNITPTNKTFSRAKTTHNNTRLLSHKKQHIPNPKPTVTTIGRTEFNLESRLSSRIKSYPLDTSKKVDYIVPIVITLIVLPLLGTAIFVLYRRGRDCWDKRHYRRMDFLIDGMYND